MILEISPEQIAQLDDTDLRTLVAYLCEREVVTRGHAAGAVTWGGHQNAPDGGIDVRVSLTAGSQISGYIPRPPTGFQVKAQTMPASKIKDEMSPHGALLASIEDLAEKGGAYIIVSSKDSVSDTFLQDRLEAMKTAVQGCTSASSLTLDFYDNRRIASWLNQHPASCHGHGRGSDFPSPAGDPSKIGQALEHHWINPTYSMIASGCFTRPSRTRRVLAPRKD